MESFLVSPKTTVLETLKRMESNDKGILFVVDDEKRLLGAITNGDIRRWIINNGDLQGTIDTIMNRDPKTIYTGENKEISEYIIINPVTALPVIDSEGVILDIIFKEEIDRKKSSIAKVPVVIMAGGKGTRLYPYTKILPKPLIPIGDVPIMERIIDRFQAFGVNSFYVTVNYKKSMIKTYFSEAKRNCKIRYVEEGRPLGTAGSLALIKEKFKKPFILTNCDILIHTDYESVYKHHKESGNELTIVTALKNIAVPYGIIDSDKNGGISAIREKPKFSYFVNTGMYVLNPELVKEIPPNTIFHMTHLANKLLEENRKVGMYPISEDSFLDMGEFEEMHRMEEKLNLKVK